MEESDKFTQIDNIWQRYVDAHKQETQARREMFMTLTPLERQRMIEIGFSKNDIYSTLTLLRDIADSDSLDEVWLHSIQIFRILITLNYGLQYIAEEIVRLLPKDQVITN